MSAIRKGAEDLLGKCPKCKHQNVKHCITPAAIQRWNSRSKLKPRACRECGCKYYLTGSK